MKPDYYAILQVSPEAESEVIRLAYKALAKKYHPDRGGQDEERMRLINEAYEVLSDGGRRAEYDRTRKVAAPPSPEPADIVARPEPVRPPKPAPVEQPPGIPVELSRLRFQQMVLGLVGLFLLYYAGQFLYERFAGGGALELFEKGEYQTCLARLDRSVAAGSRDPDVFSLRGKCYRRLEQPEKALIDFKNAIALGADSKELALEQAQALAELERYDEALTVIAELEGEEVEQLRTQLQEQLKQQREKP